MTNLIIHDEVADDLIEARDWYREIDPALAESFLEEVYLTIEKARTKPEHYNRIYRDYRRVLCDRFPYKVVFEIVEEAQAVHILAVTHTAQHPETWKERIEA